MIITGGTAKGRRLFVLKGRSIRPTSSKVREAIFNILGQDITGKKVLDLFAGTGILGIEALSRGALWAHFVDNSIKAEQLIYRNLQLCGFADMGYVQRQDILKNLSLAQHPLKGLFFDLVFIDPPYGKGYIPPILTKLSNMGILASHAVIVSESYKSDEMPSIIGNLHLSDTRTYGETKIDFYNFEDI